MFLRTPHTKRLTYQFGKRAFNTSSVSYGTRGTLFNNERSRIHESTAIRDVLRLISHDTFVIFDLDNTIVEPHNAVIGSDQWFSKLIDQATSISPDHDDAITSVIAIYNEVHHHIQVKAVEEGVIKIFNLLQEIGVPMVILTARGHELHQATIRQLNEVGIDPKGMIIFCDGKNKGDCLKADLLKFKSLPPHIVMIDDKEKHLVHVQHVAEELGIRFTGMRYGYLDDKVASVDMDRAHVELLRMYSP